MAPQKPNLLRPLTRREPGGSGSGRSRFVPLSTQTLLQGAAATAALAATAAGIYALTNLDLRPKPSETNYMGDPIHNFTPLGQNPGQVQPRQYAQQGFPPASVPTPPP